MQNTQAPSKIPLPFATSGTKNTIPETAAGITVSNQASFDVGFPAVTGTPPSSGGLPPLKQDFNGILFALSAISRWINAGGGFPFDATFASDTNVGGYPKGARLLRADGSGYWQSTTENNTSNPETNGAGWIRAEGRYSGATIVTTATTLTTEQVGTGVQVAANVTLPVGNTVPVGGAFYFFNQSGATHTITVGNTSTDYIYAPGVGYGFSTRSINLLSGDFATLMSRGNGEWDVVDGTAVLAGSGALASVLGAYLTAASAAGTYETIANANATFLTPTAGNAAYLSKISQSGSIGGTSGYIILPINSSLPFYFQWTQAPASTVGTSTTNAVNGSWPVTFPNSNTAAIATLWGVGSSFVPQGGCSCGASAVSNSVYQVQYANLSGGTKALGATVFGLGY